MCAPSSVGAIDPVGMTNASTTNARKMNAKMNATRIDSIVSLTFVSELSDFADFAAAWGEGSVYSPPRFDAPGGAGSVLVADSTDCSCIVSILRDHLRHRTSAKPNR